MAEILIDEGTGLPLLRFALIKNQKVFNIIVAKDPSFADRIRAEWDSVVDITHDESNPGIGCDYDGQSFTRSPDNAPQISIEERVQQLMDQVASIRTDVSAISAAAVTPAPAEQPAPVIVTP